MLPDLQRSIADFVLTREDDARQAGALIAPGNADRDDAGRRHIDPGDRLSIHRNNVMGSLIELLADTFEAVARQCGARNFEAAASAYIRQRPPARAQLSQYGGDFADFLDSFAPARRDLPFLPDLARLEWALNEAYFAAEANPLAPDILAEAPPERLGDLRLRLHPATRIVASPHRIYWLWRRAPTEAAAPLSRDEIDNASDVPGEHVLVVRPEAVVDAVPIGPGDHAFVTAIAAGEPLGPAVEAGMATDPAFEFQSVLGNHLMRGTFCGAVLADPARD